MSRNRTRNPNAVPAGYWSTPQVYLFTAVTLLIGIAVGYLLRGSSAPGSPAQSSAPASTSLSASMPQLPNMGSTAKVEPLLAQLQTRPNDPALLADIGNAYYDSQQYQQAIDYYQRALKFRPADVNIRTDMGTAMWYLGNADDALRQYEQSLQYQPTHAQTLLNMGIVKWEGKKDGKGALQVWQRLLQTNPNFPDRQKVEQLMGEVKAAGGS